MLPCFTFFSLFGGSNEGIILVQVNVGNLTRLKAGQIRYDPASLDSLTSLRILRLGVDASTQQMSNNKGTEVIPPPPTPFSKSSVDGQQNSVRWRHPCCTSITEINPFKSTS